METLLTGFGPFESVVDNPTSRIVRHFEREGAPGHKLTAVVLPVSFQKADSEVVRLLRQGRYDTALLLGVAARDDRVRLEAFGRNADRAGRPDAQGYLPGAEPIRLGAPQSLAPPFPVHQYVEELHELGIPAYASEDAGGYVCNRIYYAALHTIDQHALPTRCLFVHVPPDDRTFASEGHEAPAPPRMSLDTQIRAVSRILELMKEE